MKFKSKFNRREEYTPRHLRKEEGDCAPESFFQTASNTFSVFFITLSVFSLIIFAMVFADKLPEMATAIQQNPSFMAGMLLEETVQTAILAVAASLFLSVPAAFVVTVFTKNPVEAAKKAVGISNQVK